MGETTNNNMVSRKLLIVVTLCALFALGSSFPTENDVVPEEELEQASSQSSWNPFKALHKHIKHAAKAVHTHIKNIGKKSSPPKPKPVKPANGPKKVGGGCKPCPKGTHREELLQTGACPPCKRPVKKPEVVKPKPANGPKKVGGCKRCPKGTHREEVLLQTG